MLFFYILRQTGERFAIFQTKKLNVVHFFGKKLIVFIIFQLILYQNETKPNLKNRELTLQCILFAKTNRRTFRHFSEKNMSKVQCCNIFCRKTYRFCHLSIDFVPKWFKTKLKKQWINFTVHTFCKDKQANVLPYFRK